MGFVSKHSILARSVFVLHGHHLCRGIVAVLSALLRSGYLAFYHVDSENGN